MKISSAKSGSWAIFIYVFVVHTEYELSVQGSSSLANEYSLAFSETEVETGTGADIDKKDLGPTPEDGGPEKDSGGRSTAPDVIANPCTKTREGSEDGGEKEEITEM